MTATIKPLLNAMPTKDICSHGAYGDIKLLASYCGLDYLQSSLIGEWQHGWIPPERNIHPEWVIGSTGESRLHRRKRTYFVARQDQVDFLKRCGYTNVEAIGHPLIYLKASDTTRVANSLLVMPSHSTREGSAGLDEGLFQYLDYIEKIQHQFKYVKACVYQSDFDFYASHFRCKGIDVIEGALEDDQNSYERMAFLGQTFEYMTTNSFGSHVAYLSYYGARVSVAGPRVKVNQSELHKLTFYKNCPACIGHAARLHDVLSSKYPFLVSEPWLAQPQVAWAKDQLGESYKLPIGQAKSKLDVMATTPHSFLVIGNKSKKLVRKMIPNSLTRSIRSFIARASKRTKSTDRILQLALSVSTHLTKDELLCLMRFANTLPANAHGVEIGSCMGASALATCAGFISPSIRLYCIDTWTNDDMAYTKTELHDPASQNTNKYDLFISNTRCCKEFLEVQQCSSHEAFTRIEYDAKKIEWLFIDGNHSYEGVKRDWQLYSRLLVEGSLIVFHDTGWAEDVNKLITTEVIDCCTLEESLPNMKVFRYVGPAIWLPLPAENG